MKLLNEKQAASMLQCSVYTLQKSRQTGDMMPYVKIGRTVRYKEEDVRNYIVNRTFNATSQY